jgi:hypothetical protein
MQIEFVYTRGGLVQKQRRELAHHCAGERQSLLAAERQAAAVAFQVLREMENLDRALDFIFALFPRD